MKKSFFYLTTAIFLGMLAIYYYKHNIAIADEKTKKTISSINLSAPQNQPANSNKSNKSKKNIKKPENNDNTQTVVSENTQKDEKEDKEIDYITAYRNWNYFENCYTDIVDFHNKKDPLDTLKERFANNPRESQTEPTAQQNIYYQHHVEICKAMIDDEEDDYYQVRQKLHEKFLSIKPTTDEEKQLEHALQMVKRLQQFQINLNNTHYSKSTLSTAELNALNTKMQELTKQMMLIYDGSETLTEEQAAQVENYSNQIEEISNKIAQSNMPDNTKIAQLQAEIDGYKNSIDDYLHHVTSPDAFLLLADKIYRIDYYRKDSSIITTLKHTTGIKDPYYINMLNAIVMPLVACSMNYPCDPDSDYILSYCLGLRDSMFNQACGVNLEDFYFNFYIGANQLNDVNTYFNYLVNRYAQ